MADSKSEKVQAASQRKKIIIAGVAVLALCVAGVLIFWLTGRGHELEARIIEVFSVDGPQVSLTRGVEATIAASAGARLHDGYEVFTGEDSICHIRLDAASLVRMDSLSRISVNRATATTLSISVEDGQVLIDVQNQYPGHVLEVVVGNAALGVRGTLFIAGLSGAGNVQIVMLEGNVYVDDAMPISAGYVMTLQDDEPFEARPPSVGDLDMFAMQAVLDYRERVLESGALTREELEWIERLMNVPDYIWIQGVQISTSITELHICSDFTDSDGRFRPPIRERQNAYEMSLTNEEIEQLVYLTSLTRLTLHLQQISDISLLSELINLTVLHLPGNQISDLSPLAELTNLTSLMLSENQISDISPLAGLMNLRGLNLARNQIVDISLLAELTNLTFLELNGNQILDISPITGLGNLGTLYLSHNRISDISSLVGLLNLRQLWLNNNQISDITPLTGLLNLEIIQLEMNHITDITPLAELTNLRILRLDDNPITDWTPVAHVEDVRGRP